MLVWSLLWKGVQKEKQRQQALWLLQNENTKKMYDVDVLQAIKWITSIWNDIEEKMIYNCRKEIGLIVSESNNPTPIIRDEPIYLMKIEGEDDCVELLQIQNYLKQY